MRLTEDFHNKGARRDKKLLMPKTDPALRVRVVEGKPTAREQIIMGVVLSAIISYSLIVVGQGVMLCVVGASFVSEGMRLLGGGTL